MSYHAQSIYQDLSGTGSEGFGGLGLPWPFPYSPCPHLELIPPPELYCVVLISSFQKEEIYLRKGLPCLLSHMLSLVTSCHYWQSLAGSAALCLSVFGTHTSVPLPLRFLHPSSGDHCCEADFLGSGLHHDVGIPNAWAVFLGYVLNFASLALEMYATLTCWGYIQEEVQAGEGNKHARRNGESDTYFLPDCWFKTNPWKALFATRKYCQFLPNHISLWCELPEFWWAAVENNAFILFTNKGFGILSDIRKWFAALATLHMTVSKIVLKFLQDGEAEWGV